MGLLMLPKNFLLWSPNAQAGHSHMVDQEMEEDARGSEAIHLYFLFTPNSENIILKLLCCRDKISSSIKSNFVPVDVDKMKHSFE